MNTEENQEQTLYFIHDEEGEIRTEMAYRKPTDLDGFVLQMPKADMLVKAHLAEDLVTFFSDTTNSVVYQDMGLLVDGLLSWLTGSHFKIVQKTLEAFAELIKRIGPDFNAYTATVLPHVIDRLGDSRDTVREKAQLLLQTLMEYKVLSPQATIDKLAVSCFQHKKAKVREEFLQTVVNTLNEYGFGHLSMRAYTQSICALIGDPTEAVRDTAMQTLVEIYKHVGDRLRADLRKMDDLPAMKLAILEQKFDQMTSEGLLLKTALILNPIVNKGKDEADDIAIDSTGAGGGGGGGGGSLASTKPRGRTKKIVKRSTSAAVRGKSNAPLDTTSSGAVTMDYFESSFELVPQLMIFHPKEMDDVFKGIQVIINDKSADWEKRIDSLKKIRSLLLLNIHQQPAFAGQLKDMSISFLDILKEELRSQVIREACITIAYLSKTLRNKLETFCVYILEQLINLIQNSAKVIASSSTIALRYIVKYTHTSKLIKIITDTIRQSKSKDIRSALCEILCLLFEEWPTKSLERHAVVLRDTLKRSMSDADNEARRHSRRAYWIFKRHFPDLATQIYASLDIPSQRALERERDGPVGARGGMAEQHRRSATVTRRSPRAMQMPAASKRSASVADKGAAQRGNAGGNYGFYARKKTNNVTPTATTTSSLSGPRPLGVTMPTTSHARRTASSSGVVSGTRGRAGISSSQPGSRSTTPCVRMREQQPVYYRPITETTQKKNFGNSRSIVSSRETSPMRLTMMRSVYTTATAKRCKNITYKG